MGEDLRSNTLSRRVIHVTACYNLIEFCNTRAIAFAYSVLSRPLTKGSACFWNKWYREVVMIIDGFTIGGALLALLTVVVLIFVLCRDGSSGLCGDKTGNDQ